MTNVQCCAVWGHSTSVIDTTHPAAHLPLLQVQSFDQKFELMNKALLISCQKGLPVRVVRSYKVRLPAV